jgi:hypothetical protein
VRSSHERFHMLLEAESSTVELTAHRSDQPAVIPCISVGSASVTKAGDAPSEV